MHRRKKRRRWKIPCANTLPLRWKKWHLQKKVEVPTTASWVCWCINLRTTAIQTSLELKLRNVTPQFSGTWLSTNMETPCIYSTKIQKNWAYRRSGLASECPANGKWPRRMMLWRYWEKPKPNGTVCGTTTRQRRLILTIKMTPITPTICQSHALRPNSEDPWVELGTRHLWLWAKRLLRSRPSSIRSLRKSTRKVALVHFWMSTAETDEWIRLESAISTMQCRWKRALN